MRRITGFIALAALSVILPGCDNTANSNATANRNANANANANATVATTPVECKLYTSNNTSIASCRHSREYQHWIRCQSDSTSAELVEEFNGRRNHLSCPIGFDLTNHSIGVAV